MEIKCICSGSTGNFYTITQNNECVVLECGLPYKSIVKSLINARTPLNRILGVLCSHSHKDHSLACADFHKIGIHIFCPKTIELKNEYNVLRVDGQNSFTIGDWLYVEPFAVKHDTECYGYILADNITGKRVLFITDTSYFELPTQVTDYYYDKIFIECNHIRKTLDKRYEETGDFKYLRQGAFHLSLKACKKTLRKIDLSHTTEINLIHFSKELGYPEICRKDIEKTFNIKTNVC